MKNPKFSIHRVGVLWKTLSRLRNSTPKEIVLKISSILGYNPIPITLLAQQCDDEVVRSQSIQAYYLLMEEEMVRKSMELSVTA